MNFKDLNIIPPIMKAVNQVGYHQATEIQYQSIPHILNGNDLIGCAQTILNEPKEINVTPVSSTAQTVNNRFILLKKTKS